MRGKALGLTLAQVRELLGVWDSTNCGPAQEHLLRLLAEKQTELNKKRGELFGKGKDFDKDKFAELRKDGEKLAEDIKKALDEQLTGIPRDRELILYCS